MAFTSDFVIRIGPDAEVHIRKVRELEVGYEIAVEFRYADTVISSGDSLADQWHMVEDLEQDTLEAKGYEFYGRLVADLLHTPQ